MGPVPAPSLALAFVCEFISSAADCGLAIDAPLFLPPLQKMLISALRLNVERLSP